MRVCKWEDPETYQIGTVNQANQNDWPKKTWKKCPCKWFELPRVCDSGTLPLSLLMCLSTYTVLFFLQIKHFTFHYFLSLWGFLFCKTKWPGTWHWPLVWWLGFGALTSATWIQPLGRTEAPLQAAAGQDHLRPLGVPNVSDFVEDFFDVVYMLNRVWLFVMPWTIVCQAPLSMEFSRQEFWSGLPFPTQRNLPDLGIEPASPALTGRLFTTEPPGKPGDHYQPPDLLVPWSWNF